MLEIILYLIIAIGLISLFNSMTKKSIPASRNQIRKKKEDQFNQEGSNQQAPVELQDQKRNLIDQNITFVRRAGAIKESLRRQSIFNDKLSELGSETYKLDLENKAIIFLNKHNQETLEYKILKISGTFV